MHGLVAYAPDTLVVDEPALIQPAQVQPLEPGPRPDAPKPEPIDESRTVQVMLVGCRGWCREMSHVATACGKPIVSKNVVDRRSKKYDGELCKDGCWSPIELQLAQATNDIDHEDRTTGEWIPLVRRVETKDEATREANRTGRIQRRAIELAAAKDKENQKT